MLYFFYAISLIFSLGNMVRVSTIFAFLIGGAIVFVWRQIRYTNVQHIEAERKVERKVYAQKLKFPKTDLRKEFLTIQKILFPKSRAIIIKDHIGELIFLQMKRLIVLENAWLNMALWIMF